jgi:hypothetical protein
MATPLSEIIDVVNTLKSSEVVFQDTQIPFKYAKWGAVHASIPLGMDFSITLATDGNGNIVEGYIDVDLNEKQKFLCGLYAYRTFALQEHHKLTSKAVNFKTINFAVTGLTERAKEAMRIVWWCDNEIERILKALAAPMGNAEEMQYEV